MPSLYSAKPRAASIHTVIVGYSPHMQRVDTINKSSRQAPKRRKSETWILSDTYKAFVLREKHIPAVF